MLAPTNRSSVLDWLRPPPEYTLSAAVGTTYGVDADVLVASLLALMNELHEDDSRIPIDATLHALSRLSRRLRIYYQQGTVHFARARSPDLIALCDQLLVPVAIPKRVFHPKVWLLKFAAPERPEYRGAPTVYRFICGSRNLTDSRCWELGLQLEGHRGTDGTSIGRALSSFARALNLLGGEVPKPIDELARELKFVGFAGKGELRDVSFHFQWPGTSGAETLQGLLPKERRRAFVLSPFVTGEFVGGLCTSGDLKLVSRKDELDELTDTAHAVLQQRAEVFLVRRSLDPESSLADDLHAKLYVFDGGTRAESLTLLGSANATSAGFGTGDYVNIEAMVALRPGLSAERCMDEFVKGRDGRLYAWIDPYQRTDLPAPDEGVLLERRLDLLQRRLGELRVEVHFAEAEQRFEVRLAGVTSLLETPDLTLEIAPYRLLAAQRGDAWRRVAPQPDVQSFTFEQVPLALVSAFLLLRATLGGKQKEYSLQASPECLKELRGRRDELLVKQLMEGQDPTALLLRLLLGRRPGVGGPPGIAAEVAGTVRGGWTSILQKLTVERVLEACTSDPTKIDEVEAFLRTFGPVVDERFRLFWQHFMAAHQQYARRRA